MDGGENVFKLPSRKKIRMDDYDYSEVGYYFITMCTRNKECILSTIVGADIIRPQLTKIGEIVDTGINSIHAHYDNAYVDKYVIMPNHVHMIIILKGKTDVDNGASCGGRIISAPTVSTIVGQMKRWVSKQLGSSIWQKSYYDHIIRNEDDYLNICQYIQNNPENWENDEIYV